ncbi:MAG: DUF1232 domain-containing protein [Thermoanaerobacter sp.]|nr:DUF1232 domain-containing protein [Thermoanaerobacter sp.]
MSEVRKREIFEVLKRMPAYFRLIYGLYRDKDVPPRAKLLLALALTYNISPVDLIPDIIPLAGQFDNVHFTLKLLRRSLKACPEEVLKRHLENTNLCLDYLERDILISGQLMKGFGRAALNVSRRTAGYILAIPFKMGKAIFRLGKMIK